MNVQTKLRYKLMNSLLPKDLSNKVILDIGSGRNQLSKGLKTVKTIKIDGVKDYNPDICCNINDGIPLQDNSIDIIFAGEIIEHIYNSHFFISECSRILKKGGVLIISTPNLNSLKNRIKVLLGYLPEGCAIPTDNEGFERHIVDFNFNILIKIMNKYGLSITQKRSNGIISHSSLLFPLFLTPTTFGETIIIRGDKI